MSLYKNAAKPGRFALENHLARLPLRRRLHLPCACRSASIRSLFLFLFLLGIISVSLSAQEAPAFHLVSDEDQVQIILEQLPEGSYGFKPYRKGPEDEGFLPLTVGPVVPVQDPHTAYELMGTDADWIARKFGTSDPVRLWRKIRVNSGMAQALSLISPGLRMALGRTLIDRSVTAGEKYRYRIVFIDQQENELDTVTKDVTVRSGAEVPPPNKVVAEAEKGECEVKWEYKKYRGRASDLTVGFHVYRTQPGGETHRINRAPVLRIEGYLSYIDKDVETGLEYVYGVQAVDLGGRVSETVYADPVTLKDTRAPLVPMGLKALDRDEGVLLLWNISPDGDVTHYNVYRSDELEGEYTQLNQRPIPFDDPQYLDSEMQRGTAWFYSVSAVDEAGNESPRCGPSTIIPTDTEPPAGIAGLEWQVDAPSRTVELNWSPSQEKDLAGYVVYRRKSGEGLFRLTPKPIEPDKRPMYRDQGFREKGLKSGAVYTYEVAAVDTSGNESPREAIEITIPDLEPPGRVFSFSVGPTRAGGVRLRWQPTLSEDLSIHRIFRRRDGEKDQQIIAELDAEIQEYLDEDVERGVPYEYTLVEVDTAGNAGEPSRKKRIVPVDITAPAPPTALQVQRRDRTLLIRWAAPEDTDVAGYRVYRAPYPRAKQKLLTGELIKEQRFVDKAVIDGAVYEISAVDTSGNEGDTARLRYQPEEETE